MGLSVLDNLWFNREEADFTAVNPSFYPKAVPPPLIPKWKRFLAKYLGRIVFWGWDLQHFKEPMKIYLLYCRKHRIFYIDYPHGYRQYFNCPKCLEEWRRKERW